MLKKPIITSTQLLMLAVGSSLTFPYTFMPILNTPPGNQDVWIVLIITFVYILAINMPILYLMNKFRGINITEANDIILGKFFGKVAIIPLLLFFLFCYSACMLMMAMFINIYIFPDTPMWALLLSLAVPSCYAAYKGAGTIGRLACFLVPIMLFTIVLFFIFGLGEMDFNILKPVLADSTFLELNLGGFLTASRYSEILIFFVFSYYLGKKASINKTYATALVLFGISFFLMLLPTVLVLGVEYAKHSWNPYYAFTSQIEAFDFLERVQSINLLAWFPVSLLKLAMFNYMAGYVFSDLVKAKTYKYFVTPFAVIGFILCLLPIMNKSSTMEFLRSDKFFPWIVLPITLVIPLIVLIVYFVRRKKIDPVIKQKTAAEK